MIEIILLYFLCKHIGMMAQQKGLNPTAWKIYTILCWVGAEFLGFIIGMSLFGFNKNNLVGLMGFALVCAFGGYLFIRKIIENKKSQTEL
jgi:hypothetical protein